MYDVPAHIKNEYAKLLEQLGIPLHSHNFYQKWLRFYFDFCHKYKHEPTNQGSLTHFIKKLHEKNQTSRQQSQASHAIRLYYEQKNSDTLNKSPTQKNNSVQNSAATPTQERKLWAKIYSDLNTAIKVRHYSPKTYKSYAGWIRQFQNFTQEKAPDSLTIDHVKSFLTHLAVKQSGSMSFLAGNFFRKSVYTLRGSN